MIHNRRGATVSVVCVYGALLAVSFYVRGRTASGRPLRPGDRSITVRQVAHDAANSTPVRMVFREFGPVNSGTPHVVLLHGSPGRKEDFDRVVSTIAVRAHVIVPDLPGFGASEHDVPDYSFRAHARYANQLLEQLGIERAHIVGYSMGGGVALNLSDIAPNRVASLTMVSAIGVQEMELTGDYYVNHALHGIQLAALYGLRVVTPHMGMLDGAMLGVSYARNFFDSDQRPLRDVLRRVGVPTLIVHGVDDAAVPIEAAREHARLVPHSELAVFDGDHFLIFARAPLIGQVLTHFVERVERGFARTRPEATEDRVNASLVKESEPRFPEARGVAARVFSALIVAATLVSIAVGGAFAGSLTASGHMGLLSATAAYTSGVVSGAWLRYVLWRTGLARQPTPLPTLVLALALTPMTLGGSVLVALFVYRLCAVAAPSVSSYWFVIATILSFASSTGLFRLARSRIIQTSTIETVG